VDPALKEFLEEATQGSAQPARERAAAAKVSKRPRGLPAGFEIAPIPEAPEISLPEGNRESQWNWLRERVLNCPVCREHVKPGKQIVFGTGHLEADIFFCGEAPGAEEENHGEPFVGRAGELLNKIITAMGLTRAEVYIGNIMNWRPETPSPSGNRPPSDEELAFCLPFLRAQIEIVRPRVIVALGSTAVTGLLGPDPKRRMGRLRGTWQSFEGTPLMVTYHPSYVLRQDTKVIKRQIWEDMLQVMEHVGLKISDKQRRYFN
jgi:DNA polymerase